MQGITCVIGTFWGFLDAFWSILTSLKGDFMHFTKLGEQGTILRALVVIFRAFEAIRGHYFKGFNMLFSSINYGTIKCIMSS